MADLGGINDSPQPPGNQGQIHLALGNWIDYGMRRICKVCSENAVKVEYRQERRTIK